MRGQAKHLSKSVAIYGAGDAVINVFNLALMWVYVHFNLLTLIDYGALGLVGATETFAKIISRFGLDHAFMRFYYERADGRERQVMTSTIVWSLVAVNAVWLTVALIISPWLADTLKIGSGYVTALRLMFINMGLIAFTFVPLHTMRMRKEAATYSAFTFGRSAGQAVLRVLFVIVLRMGVTGMYVTDLVLTVVLLSFMWPWLRPLLRWTFSTSELRQSLRFSLPRLPQGLASQALDSTPKVLLGQHFPESTVGIYQNGTTLGAVVAFFKAAVETAYAPFYYETARQPDARTVFSKMATYGIVVFVLLVAGTTAVARDVVLLVLRREYLAAVPVVPIIATAIALQGVYQLTSIGLNLTKRTEFYPASTMAAALVGVGSGLWLVPAYGVVGAAVSVLLAYATQAVAAFVLAQRLYPMRYEVGRLARVVVAGVSGATLGRLLPDMPPLAGFLLRGSVCVVAFAAILWVTGFFRATERAFLRELVDRARARRAATHGAR